MVILEYCELGSLQCYLEDHAVNEDMKLAFACQCSDGLAYLSGRGFIHRDIAARNVLLSSELKCKISDVSKHFCEREVLLILLFFPFFLSFFFSSSSFYFNSHTLSLLTVWNVARNK